jgi:hypothetical protein
VQAAKFLDAVHGDGDIAGIVGARTSGMLRCTTKFNGAP